MPKGHGPALDTVGVPLCVRLGLLYRKDKDMAEKEPSQRQLRVGQEIKKILAGEIERGLVRNLEGRKFAKLCSWRPIISAKSSAQRWSFVMCRS